MSDADLIEGKVARILNSRELVINRGSQHGVEEDMYFAVYDRSPETVKDPETGELLGQVLRPKVKVQVVAVQDRFCVAQTYETQHVNVGGFGVIGTDFSKMLQPPKWETHVQTLKTNEATWERLEESQSFVKTGDIVRQILDPELGTALEELESTEEQQ